MGVFQKMQWEGLGRDEGGSPIRGYIEVERMRRVCPPVECLVTDSFKLAE